MSMEFGVEENRQDKTNENCTVIHASVNQSVCRKACWNSVAEDVQVVFKTDEDSRVVFEVHNRQVPERENEIIH